MRGMPTIDRARMSSWRGRRSISLDNWPGRLLFDCLFSFPVSVGYAGGRRVRPWISWSRSPPLRGEK